MVMNKYRNTQQDVCTTPHCFAADYDKCIGTNSGRPFAFGIRSIAALSCANIDERLVLVDLVNGVNGGAPLAMTPLCDTL